jgi:hypothetical protein
MLPENGNRSKAKPWSGDLDAGFDMGLFFATNWRVPAALHPRHRQMPILLRVQPSRLHVQSPIRCKL